MKEKVLQEITEKRDRYTKHFMLPEKGTAAAVYPEPVHYETESGWEEIDNRLEAVSKDGKECYQNKASDLQVCFAKQTGENTLVSMEKDGKKFHGQWKKMWYWQEAQGRQEQEKAVFRY